MITAGNRVYLKTWIEDALSVIELLCWGAFGGLGVEAIHLLRAVRRINGLPWKAPGEPSLAALVLSVGIRVVIGGGLALAAGASAQISGPMGALAIGVCAPLVIDQIGTTAPVALPTPGNATTSLTEAVAETGGPHA